MIDEFVLVLTFADTQLLLLLQPFRTLSFVSKFLDMKHVLLLRILILLGFVFSSLNAAEHLGFDSAAFLENELVVAADTSCNAAYRGIQMLMEGEQATLNSASTIDLGAAAAENPDGTILNCEHTQHASFVL